MKEITEIPIVEVLLYTLILGVVMVLGSCKFITQPFVSHECIIVEKDTSAYSAEYTCESWSGDRIRLVGSKAEMQLGDTMDIKKRVRHQTDNIEVPEEWEALSHDYFHQDTLIAYSDVNSRIHISFTGKHQ